MLHRSSRLVAWVAAGALSLALAACGSDSDGSAKGDALSDKRTGAMESYKVGDQFKATKPLTFDVLYSDHANYPIKKDWLLWSEITKRTNVTVNPIVVPRSDYEQKRSLLIGAGDAPPIIPKTYPGQETAFVASGAILPVSDYLDLMPNLKDKIAKWNLQGDVDALRQENGKFYLLPGVHEEVWPDYALAIRTDVLDQLKLQPPKTLDDLYTVLKAMKAAYPNSYPFSDEFNKPDAGGNLFNLLGVAFGTHAGNWDTDKVTWHPDTKKFTFAASDPGYQQMVAYLNKLVTEKLIDPESFTQDDDTAFQKIAQNKSFVMTANAQAVVNKIRPAVTKVNPKANVVKIPFPTGPAGEVKRGTRLENGIMISSKAKDSPNFVAMMQFVDWLWYSDAGQEFTKWGVPGVTYSKDASGKRTLNPDVDFVGLNPKGTKHLQKDFGFSGGVFAYGGTTDLLESTFSDEEKTFQAAMRQRKTLELPPPRPLTADEREEVTLLEGQLKDYVNAQTLRFVLGQRPLAQWDAFQSELKGKGVDKYLETINSAYERYAKAHAG